MMKQMLNLKLFLVCTFFILAAACSKNTESGIAQQSTQQPSLNEMMKENGENPDELMMSTSVESSNTAVNSVEKNASRYGQFLYTESNETGTNQILIYGIKKDGSLVYSTSVASGGAGTGSGLGSQGAIVLDKHHQWLFAVNAGSNSVSAFKVHKDGSLSLASTESSKGVKPVSVDVSGNLLYVLNTGSDNIHGFRVGAEGELHHIGGSTKSLSGSGTDAPQIMFTPGGDRLVVTEKATNNLLTFKIKNDGSVRDAIITRSTGMTPFGFAFSRDEFMVISNAVGGAAGAGSATSYVIGGNGVPNDINGAVPNNQAAPCWVAITKYGRFAFVTNTASNSISSYYISARGALYLVHPAAAATDNGPVDIVVAGNNYNVYTLNGKAGTLGEYHRTFLGGLELTGTVSGLPTSTTGLASF
jgi:6-phosphogluconolactonase (cycloisomerase 2 family)